jgi:aspartate/methionine/tyrosine aminotransferase
MGMTHPAATTATTSTTATTAMERSTQMDAATNLLAAGPVRLFDHYPQGLGSDPACQALVGLGRSVGPAQVRRTTILPYVGERLTDVFARAVNPEDPFELCSLYVGRAEAELATPTHWPHLTDRWSSSRIRRQVSPGEILSSTATSRFIKELFNFYFRDALYGALQDDETLVMSSGAADETLFGLPKPLRDCVVYALDQGWYGYSDSRGRLPSREAIARYETASSLYNTYAADNISITMGSTVAMNSIADFLAHRQRAGETLCLLPNYPPLVEAAARHSRIRLVPAASGAGRTDLEPLIAALGPGTRMVMLQTVTNPTGCAVDEQQLEKLITAAGPDTVVVLDEAHECSGARSQHSAARSAPNVVRLASLSKSLRIPGLKLGWIVASSAFMADYYEYASTTYGGPPSVFALLTEAVARFERWTLEGVDSPGAEHVAEFEAHCGLERNSLGAAYRDYVAQRTVQEQAIEGSRVWFEHALVDLGWEAVTPQYSSNICARPPRAGDSYGDFRRILSAAGVSVYPGALNCLLDESAVRFTSAQRPEKLTEVRRRLEAASKTLS